MLVPTRELALQVQKSFSDYGKHLPLRNTVIFGGVGDSPQKKALQRGVDVLVATPGRLLDLQSQGAIHLRKLEIFVLDEADRMLDMGFVHDIRKVVALLPAHRQNLFFSATMPPDIASLAGTILNDPTRVEVVPQSTPIERIDQRLYYAEKAQKTLLLCALVEELKATRALVFTRTKHGANRVCEKLQKAGISAAAIHGNKSQTRRVEALEGFRAGTVRVPVSLRSVHLLIWMNPSCPAVSAAFMYSSLKSPVLTMSSPPCSVAAALPALPLQLLISSQYSG